MTDTTDTAALRRRSNNLRTADQTDAFIDLLLDKLEAERQRADEAVKERVASIAARRKSSTQWREQFDAVHQRAKKAEAELAALREKYENS